MRPKTYLQAALGAVVMLAAIMVLVAQGYHKSYGVAAALAAIPAVATGLAGSIRIAGKTRERQQQSR